MTSNKTFTPGILRICISWSSSLTLKKGPESLLNVVRVWSSYRKLQDRTTNPVIGVLVLLTLVLLTEPWCRKIFQRVHIPFFVTIKCISVLILKDAFRIAPSDALMVVNYISFLIQSNTNAICCLLDPQCGNCLWYLGKHFSEVIVVFSLCSAAKTLAKHFINAALIWGVWSNWKMMKINIYTEKWRQK